MAVNRGPAFLRGIDFSEGYDFENFEWEVTVADLQNAYIGEMSGDLIALIPAGDNSGQYLVLTQDCETLRDAEIRPFNLQELAILRKTDLSHHFRR